MISGHCIGLPLDGLQAEGNSYGGYDMSDVKKQHYVPRFYLKSFTNQDGFLYAVKREPDGLGHIFKNKPEGICFERYLHEVKRRAPIHGERFIEQGSAEKALSKMENGLANSYRRLIKQLDAGGFSDTDETCELLERLILLISLLLVRTPKYLKRIRSNAATYAAELESGGFLTEDDRKEMDAEGFGGEFESIVELAIQDVALFKFCEGAPLYSLVSSMLKMDCSFFVAPEGSEFIASSLPVFPEWVDIQDSDPYSIYLPLSPRYGVVFKQKSEDDRLVSISHIDGAAVNVINHALMHSNDSWDFLIARDRECLELLVSE